MSKANWRGSFAIPMTPYDQQDRIDEGALRAEIRFCIAAGVGGICLPLLVSEFRSLSEDERRLMIRVGVEECHGSDVPVVANVAAVNTPLAVGYAEYAATVGADAVMAMPPYIERPDWPMIRAYYTEIARAARMPVWIQNAGLAALSADEILVLCHDIEHVNWVKQEVPPAPTRLPPFSIGIRLIFMGSWAALAESICWLNGRAVPPVVSMPASSAMSFNAFGIY